MAEIRKIDIALARPGDDLIKLAKDGSYYVRTIYGREEKRGFLETKSIVFEVSDQDDPMVYYLEDWPNFAWDGYELLVDLKGTNVDLTWLYDVQPSDTLLLNKNLFVVKTIFVDETGSKAFITSDDEVIRPKGYLVPVLKPKSSKS